jgi:hypothetical protein
MHPQTDQLREAIARFLANPEATLEVFCPDKRLSVVFSHRALLARPRRSLSPTFRRVAYLVTPMPDDAKSVARAERLGFERTMRTAYNPKTNEALPVPQIGAQFVDADDGADWCLAALQDLHGINVAWLWISGLPYSSWPQPLPKPDIWPPESGTGPQ